MILSQRVHHSPSRTISYPIDSELAPCSSSQRLASSPRPPRGHKHSLSKQMTWLSRSSSSTSSHSVPHAASKPTRISEPKVGSSLEQFNFHRCGPLGSGATIVRTPQEALSGPCRASELISEEEVKGEALLHNTEKNESRLLPPLPPPSPPLPPLPPSISDGGGGGASTSIHLSDHVPHRCSSGSTSSAVHFSSSKPTLVGHSRAPSRSVPALPACTEMGPQPPFEVILLSSIPDGPIDPSKLIVTLETCTATYRTSLRTLASRPSHLSRYITSLSPVSETASIYSNASDASLVQHSGGFNSVFRDHLASPGCLPQSSAGIHIFLDRPSGPYMQVLAYLRSLPSAPEQPSETLPRAVQLEPGSMSPSRLESLLDLRDEASYLGLAELEKLCCHEIQRFHRVPIMTSATGGGTFRGKTGSVHSVHTVVEEWEPHQEARPSERQVSKGDSNTRTTESTARMSSSSLSCENKDMPVHERGRERRGIKYEMGSPPPGWI